MIKTFNHKGLEKFFATGNTSGIQFKHAKRLHLILGRLNVAVTADDMNLPGLNLHPLSGNREGVWAVKVSSNWRVRFRFEGEDVILVNYEDYH